MSSLLSCLKNIELAPKIFQGQKIMNENDFIMKISVFRISVLNAWRCHGDDDGKTLGAEEARSSAGFQSRSSGQCTGPAGHGPQSSWIKNRFYLATWSSRGSPTPKWREGTIFSRSLATSLQVYFFSSRFLFLLPCNSTYFISQILRYHS